jgi:hypothetical protein
MIVCALACSLVAAACGGSSSDDSDSASAPAGLVIPAGNYTTAKSISAGQETAASRQSLVVVTHIGAKTQFTVTGLIADGYSCQPRVWLAKIDAAGDASEVERTQENCTQSITKAAYEALKRNYRLNGTGFIERISDADVQIELYYDRK